MSIAGSGEGSMKARELIYVTKGTKLILKDKAYRYTYAFFVLERPKVYLYTYVYEEEECWCSYCEEYSSKTFHSENMEFSERNLPSSGEGYIRLTVMGENGELQEITDTVLEVRSTHTEAEMLEKTEKSFLLRADVQAEIAETVSKIQEKRTQGSLVFTILSDTHYVLNGNWETCAASIEAVNRQVKPDGIIHLGDLTDGILDKTVCRNYSRKVLDRIFNWELPFYMTIGNHDVNYFKRNPDILSEEEQYDYYLRDTVSGELTEGQLWYHVDFPEQKLRFLFLHSYDNTEALRYGFPQAELEWVRMQLEQLPEGYQVILFSHDAPLARLDYWSKEIRNGEAMVGLLDTWNRAHGYRIMAFIHGHTHADYIYEKRTFPIISVGCAKIEYFEDKKPDGAVTPVRIEGEVSQELWDTMIVDTRERRLEFVRFGAGNDRSVSTKIKEEPETVKAERGKERGMQQEQKTKIWAHRGASGHAPENTLEAFALAEKMGADGVELDVQLTKDRQLVVIHDERIDRVSNGHGLVADYTLAELKSFCFNRTHPEYADAEIPTLCEVLELLKPTKLTVNIELKTGVNFYPGIEKETVRLVQELGMEERVIYSSFNHASVMKVKELAPQAQTGFLYCDGTLEMPEYAVGHGVDALHPARYNLKYPGFIEACRKNQIKLHVWTVNEKPEMEQMIQLGINAIITNYPDRAYEVIYGESPIVPETPKMEKAMEQPAKIKEIQSVPENPKLTEKKEETLPHAENRQASAETAGTEQKETKPAEKKKKNALLHLLGVTYGKVRKVFVAIDRAVQEAAR